MKDIFEEIAVLFVLFKSGEKLGHLHSKLSLQPNTVDMDFALCQITHMMDLFWIEIGLSSYAIWY